MVIDPFISQVNPKLLQKHVNETLLPSLSLKKTTISNRNCQRWLWKLGYRRKGHHKGVYWDRHERKDVKKRRKEYLAELEAIEPFSAQYAELDMGEVSLELGDDEVEHVVITHDESTEVGVNREHAGRCLNAVAGGRGGKTS
ncbi:hypothetical protein C8J57DRAFT_1064813 [Mycena rebaudengoi]|nr:hypothetical protein C8J57DRAFT_1064813 [Mycena rebaudengoi]